MADKNIIFITGGNTGIGYETVKALFQSGKAYHVLMGSRSLEKAKTAIDTLQQEVPQTTSTIEAVQIDVLDDDSIEKAFETVKARHDHIDSLINNAGKSSQTEPSTKRGSEGLIEGIGCGSQVLRTTSMAGYEASGTCLTRHST